VVAQASRRSWRIGQRHAVHIHHVVYAASAQENALRLVARKRRAAKLVDGDLDEDGLVAQAEMDGLLKELARSLVDEDATAAVESAEEILAQARADELADSAFIVDTTAAEDATDDEASEAIPEEDLALPTVAGTTVSLFDYMAAHPSASRKGKKMRKTIPSAQLLLFDLFGETAAATGPAPITADAEVEQLGLFSGAAR